eukprot:423120-Amphidinium_carterae.1
MVSPEDTTIGSHMLPSWDVCQMHKRMGCYALHPGSSSLLWSRLKDDALASMTIHNQDHPGSSIWCANTPLGWSSPCKCSKTKPNYK